MSNGVQIADPKAPWVMFERRDVEDRNASLEAGHYVTRDIDYALITPHGSRDQIERVVAEWFPMLEQQVREQRFDPAWLRAYKAAYAEWKEGKEIPVEGTSILNWPVLSPAQIRLLTTNKVLTVEVLAQANEETLARLGMGARKLKQLAVDYLASAEGPGKVASRMSKLETDNERLQGLVKAQADLIEDLSARVPKHPNGEQMDRQEIAEAPRNNSGGIGMEDLIDTAMDAKPPRHALPPLEPIRKL